MKQIIIPTSDGYKLSAIYVTPPGDSIGAIILSSATGVKKEYYIAFALFLVQNGYSVLLFDYRGIGGSAPVNLRTENAYMHEWGTKDMNAALDYLVYSKGFTNIIWVGHSVGAQLIGFVINRRHISKVIAINAALGYWRHFPVPKSWLIWALWFFIGPLMVKIYGYGKMQKIGWGENLPKNILMEWRTWCLSKTYFRTCLQQLLQTDKFYEFTTPITAVYTSDDFIANDKTVPLMMKFFPNAPQQIVKLAVNEFTIDKVGHAGIFRKRFEKTLWPWLVEVIER